MSDLEENSSWMEKLQSSLGLEDRRTKEDFRLFYMSARDHYDDLRPSYVARNISFLMDSIYITLSHATKPTRNPTGFGLSLGSFLGMIDKAKDSSVCLVLFKDEQAYSFLNKCTDLLKKVDGLDKESIKVAIQDMDISKLEEIGRAHV